MLLKTQGCSDLSVSLNHQFCISRMGAHYKRGSVGTEQNIKVQRIVMHPRYNNPKRYAHDIALIKLASPARLNKAVGIACMPPDDVAGLQDGKKCWITGEHTFYLTSDHFQMNVTTHCIFPRTILNIATY